MAGYVTLMGAEQVQSAGNRMLSAAEQMNRAASSIDESLHRHQQFLNDWLQQFATTLDEAVGKRP